MWWEVLLSALGGSVVTGIGGILYIRPRLKTEKAGASKATTEAQEAQFDLLLKRVQSMEELYKHQGDTMDGMRKRQLELENEVQNLQIKGLEMATENKKLRTALEKVEAENVSLRQEVNRLTQELNDYRSKKSKTNQG